MGKVAARQEPGPDNAIAPQKAQKSTLADGALPEQGTPMGLLLSLQRQAGNAATVNYLQRSEKDTTAPPRSAVRDTIGRRGAALDSTTRIAMERHLDTNLDDVQLHVDRESAESVSAAAYTVGSDIVVHPDHYRPGAPSLQRLLAHELTHVVQQRSGPVDGTPAGAGVRISEPSDAFEQEAERSADAFQSGRKFKVARSHAHTNRDFAHDDVDDNDVQRVVVVQRHSSWEHRLLGDAKLTDLAKMGAWQDVIDDQKTKSKDAPIFKGSQQQGSVEIDGVGQVNKGQIMHVLVQEMTRLKNWQSAPPTESSTDEVDLTKESPELKKNEAYDVMVVRLPGNDELITYGELNTLADFFGNYETMTKADPTQRHKILQSVRQETYLRLQEIYTNLTTSLTTKEKTNEDVVGAKQLYGDNELKGFQFKGAMEDLVSTDGQLALLLGKEGTTDERPKVGFNKFGIGTTGEENQYAPTLARNACHFAPESWLSWAKYHDEAITDAKAANDKWEEADSLKEQLADLAGDDDDEVVDPVQQEKLTKEMEAAKSEYSKLSNQALLKNGFGDHYLQDSYAAGHLINKTQIMQWYVEYMDNSKWNWDYFKDKNWRKVQQMAYLQEGLASPEQYDKTKIEGYQAGGPKIAARNPQLVEDLPGDWQVRFRALGLVVPPALEDTESDERNVLESWQQYVVRDPKKRTLKGSEMPAEDEDLDGTVESAIASLVKLGVVRTTGKVSSDSVETRGKQMRGPESPTFDDFAEQRFVLREDYVAAAQKLATDKAERAKAHVGENEDDYEDEDANEAAYQKTLQAITYGDYFEFMSSSFIQRATSKLHDTFCKEGLQVKAKAEDVAFTVYGDDNMFNKEASEGVAMSGKTANMSRDAIVNVIEEGSVGTNTTKKILDRLPAFVEYKTPDGELQTDSLELWHDPKNETGLKQRAFKKLFPGMSGNPKQTAVPGAKGSLGKITKDPHGRDAF